MELLPIIYSSLLIFAGLMIAAILFSYMAHKVKKRKNPESIVDEEPVYLKPPTLTRGQTQTPVVLPKNKSEKKKSSRAKKEEKAKPEARKSPGSKKTAKKSPDRYKVVTQLSKSAKTTQKKKKEDDPQAKLKSLGDNVFEKYVEDEEEKFYSLKTDKDKKNKK